MNKNPITKELIAPCGMNCAICSRYLSYINNLKRSQCIGCRPRNQRCTYLFSKCRGINNNTLTGNAAFYFECNQYPCKQINRIDKRYKNNYKMSMKDNFDYIKKMGINKFINKQYKKYYIIGYIMERKFDIIIDKKTGNKTQVYKTGEHIDKFSNGKI